MDRTPTILSVAATLLVALAAVPARAQEAKRVTMLFDAFGKPSALERDWGFAAFVEYGGRRILFDTGNDAGIFAANVKALGVDLERLDAVVISHRHGDHTSGLSTVLEANPSVTIYAPSDAALFIRRTPPDFFKRYPGLPSHLSYYGGEEPPVRGKGTPWDGAKFEVVTQTKEIFPGFYIFTTKSEKAGTVEMNEVSLAIRTPRGLAVVVGCSHPGVEKILEEAVKIDSRLYTVTGGFHLVLAPEEEVQRVAALLDDTLRIERVAPGHCTSELGFAVFLDRFKERFDAAGVGAVIALP